MNLRRAIAGTLRSRRFWKWELGGIIIYSLPAAMRFITKNSYIPILSWPGLVHNYYIPGNLVEKILVNAFFPGGAGGVAGEVFARNCSGKPIRKRTMYLARLGGALTQTALWSAFQFWGYHQFYVGPYGGNVFEPPTVLPFNFLLAAFSIFTPDVLHFAISGFERVYGRIQESVAEKS